MYGKSLYAEVKDEEVTNDNKQVSIKEVINVSNKSQNK